ncbi:MAG: class I SAM-dependent methyltransferase [Actinomycetota bacterium]
MSVIPFYGAEDPELFAIERRAMDRDGLVIDGLHELLPPGLVLDVGAGEGFTAERLGPGRSIVALEPSAGMLSRADLRCRVRGEAEHLPFVEAAFDAAYATWAYFFTRDWDPTPGIAELDRVVRPGGPLAIVDNLGGDAFAAMAEADISADPAAWQALGFTCDVIETAFRFEDLEEAQRLLGFFFGDRGVAGAALDVPFRVGVFHRSSRGA